MVALILGVLIGRWQNNARDDGRLDPISGIVQSVTVGPAAAVKGTLTSTRDFFGSFGEGASLRRENAALKAELSAAKLYAEREAAWLVERSELRKLAGLPILPGQTPVRGIALNYQVRENRMTLNVGSREGVAPGMPVLAGGGLLGVVQTVTEKTCQINLVTSPQLRIGVRILREPPELGIIRGDGFTKLTVEYMSSSSRTEAGDRVVTSGFGERIPPGIPIGQIVEIQKVQEFGARRATVVPDITLGSVREVVVLR